MRRDSAADQPTLNGWVAPPRRAVGLGLRLGLLTTLVVAGVMAVLSGTQLALELRAELHERRAQLGESLAPLVTDLQHALTRDDVRAAVARFHASYVEQGHSYHSLVVADSTGRELLGTRAERNQKPQALLTASVSLVSPAFGRRPVMLSISADTFDYAAARARRWWEWAVHVGVTALLILALLYIVIRREVTGPIDRLLAGVRTMELGYWGDVPDPGGAWEVRWLGWRFRSLGQELNRTVELLVAAQRRAYSTDQERATESEATGADVLSTPAVSIPRNVGDAIAWLRTQLGRLERTDQGDAAAKSLAQVALNQHALEAERLGQSELRLSLEDAALRVIDPDGFLEVSTRIAAERGALEAQARGREAQIRRALEVHGVPIVELSHRVKHAAGIWKKMHAKHLAFEQIHDLVALRIVVPTETDCYHALGAVHDLYAPIVGRFKDYIAQPKPNGYRGLHTSVRSAEGAAFEVQVRSTAMHRQAAHGPAGYAEYKHATRVTASTARTTLWTRMLGLFGSGPRRPAQGSNGAP